MKHSTILTLVIMLLLAVAHNGKAQVKAFEKLRNTPDVTYVYISQTMLRMAKGSVKSNVGNKDVDLSNMLDKLTGLQIINTEKAQKATEIKKLVSDIVAKEKYDVVMDVAEDNDVVTIYSQITSKQSVVLLVNEDAKDHDLSLLVFSGKFTEGDLMNITVDSKKKEKK